MSEESQTTSTSESDSALGGQEAATASEPSWIDNISEEYRETGFVKQFADQDLDSFVKSAIHANSMVGADKLKMLNDKSTDEEINAFYNKLGRPETSEDYSLPEKFASEDSGVDQDLVKSFHQAAHKMGLTDKQQAEVIQFQMEMSQKAHESSQMQVVDRDSQWDAQLREEFGNAYDERVKLAQDVLGKFGNENTISAINELGVGNNPELVKVFAEIGKAMKVDPIIGDGQGATFESSPTENKARLEQFQVENYKALIDNSHKDHVRIKAEQQALLEKVVGKME